MINVAIIGTGNIANFHMQSLLKFRDRCKIVALVDIAPAKAQACKEKYDLNDAVVFASHGDMIASGMKIDLVHNCTPPFAHASVSIDCMNAGIDVFVEKPMAASLKECDDMIAARDKNGVMLHVVAQNRFRDIHMKLKQLKDSGIAGKIRVAHVNSLWWRGHSYYDLWWRGMWEKEGGGPTLNHAVHHIDLINWIYGELPKEVTAVLANVAHDNSEVEDVSFAILRYNDGAMATITSSVVHHGQEQNIELQGMDAKITAPFSCHACKGHPSGFPYDNTELMEKITQMHDNMLNLEYEGHEGQIDNILTYMETGKAPLIAAEDGRKTLELITAIYKAGCTKQMATLPISPSDEFYTFEGLLKNAIYFYEKANSVEDLGSDGVRTY
ncbi:MAG: Gfo/Idh/MocA family oxidoreductase [Defluviitaleaceae bacterium]|nr:Gfo/Idh/MocA family oxidoreductase [Defluviitaleaceae bacterium]